MLLRLSISGLVLVALIAGIWIWNDWKTPLVIVRNDGGDALHNLIVKIESGQFYHAVKIDLLESKEQQKVKVPAFTEKTVNLFFLDQRNIPHQSESFNWSGSDMILKVKSNYEIEVKSQRF